MDQKENLLEKDLSLVVVLPGGVENVTTVRGSKPMMDLLVMLCAKYHLNPSGHTIELVTANRNHIKFKPNALIGTLEAERILLKPKGAEDKNKKPTAPQMPEATVRLVINYRKTQKTILRVNPRVPLEELLPAICEKCEFDQQTTLLLRDVQSPDPLDLKSCLNDFGIREVYAKDTKGLCPADVPSSPECPGSPSFADTITPGKDKNQKEKENKGLFSLFRRSRKKSDQAVTASAPASPVLSKPRPLSMASLGAHCSTYDNHSMSADGPKKRRAPLPPMLVSQSCPSEPTPRQRLSSEPVIQRDRDQVSALVQGSPRESSLKRTKRKAPPPPTPPTVAVEEETSLDGSFKGDQAQTTLEEIEEQEETTASMVLDLDAASDALEDDASLTLSGDVFMDSDKAEDHSLPAQEVEMPGSALSESTGEDQSGDLSSDGKLVQSTMDNATESTDPLQMNSTELVDNGSAPCGAEGEGEQTHASAEDSSTAQGVSVECSSVSPSSPARPESRDPESQASGQPYTEPTAEESFPLGKEPAHCPSCPPEEDAQVQSVSTPSSAPSHQQKEVPSPAKPSVSAPVEQKRDIATSTEESNCPGFQPALPPTSELPLPCQQVASPSAPAATKPAPCYTADSEPKPKPSNEVTRDYIPKVGMTTYTIVPQKTLEKLRYFEVELTLEAPPLMDPEGNADIASLKLEGHTAVQDVVTAQTTDVESSTPAENPEHGTTTSESTVNGSTATPIHSPSTRATLLVGEDKTSPAVTDSVQAGLPSEVREIKIPPATKPKPGSFRLPQYKRTPGDYVTSAAVKSASASPGAGQKEAPASLEREQTLLPVEEASSSPPPPPPPLPHPVQGQEESTGGAPVQQSPNGEEGRRTGSVPSEQGTRQTSPALSLAKLRSFAAPRPYTPSTPSRFAQAVSSAVRRSQSVSAEPTSPRMPPFYPIATGRFSIKEPKGLHHSKGTDSREGEEERGSTQQGGVEDPRWGSDDDTAARTAGQSQPEQGPGALGEQPASNGTTDTFTELDAPALPSAGPETLA